MSLYYIEYRVKVGLADRKLTFSAVIHDKGGEPAVILQAVKDDEQKRVNRIVLRDTIPATDIEEISAVETFENLTNEGCVMLAYNFGQGYFNDKPDENEHGYMFDSIEFDTEDE